MDTLTSIENIINKFNNDSANRPEEWVISPKLIKKVTIDGDFQPFYGYTSVFPLPLYAIEKLKSISSSFLEEVNGLLIPLPFDTYHITLHTFFNQNNVKNLDEVDIKMDETKDIREEAFKTILYKYKGHKITLNCLGISSDGSDVVSFKFVPTEESSALLFELFKIMEGVCPLGQKYLPHISIGYFSQRNYSREEIDRVFDAIEKYSSLCNFTFELDIDSLKFEKHYKMDRYYEIPWKNKGR